MSLLKRIEQGQSAQPQGPAGGGNPAVAGTTRLPPPIERKRPPTPGPGTRDTYYDLKARVQNKLLSELEPSMDVSQTADVRVRATVQAVVPGLSLTVDVESRSPTERFQGRAP